VQLKPVSFTDDDWRKIQALFPLPIEARRPIEDRVAMHVHLHQSSTAPAERRDVLLHLRDLAEELHRGLSSLDGETLMVLLQGRADTASHNVLELAAVGDKPLGDWLSGDIVASAPSDMVANVPTLSAAPLRHMSELLTERQVQLAHLAHWLQLAANNVPRGKPGRDGSGFEWLLDQCDLILQHFGAGKISRADRNDRTNKFTKILLDTIQGATGQRPLATGGSAVRKTVTRRGKKAPKKRMSVYSAKNET
jgi:hypothetical protein